MPGCVWCSPCHLFGDNDMDRWCQHMRGSWGQPSGRALGLPGLGSREGFLGEATRAPEDDQELPGG